MRQIVRIAILLSGVLLARPACAQDSAAGKKLHEANCTGCHNSNVYTRADRHVKSLAALNEQLTRCTHAAQVKLSEAEQKSIAQYLNEQFYKFK